MVDYDMDQHEARLLVGDPVAEAYEWIKAYAENLSDQCSHEDHNEPITMEELIDVGMSHVDDKSWGDYIVRGGAFEGTSTDPTFWDKLATLKGIEIPSSKRGSFFSCSC